MDSKAPSMSSGSEIADTFSSNSYSLTRKMLITRKQKRTLNSWRGLYLAIKTPGNKT